MKYAVTCVFKDGNYWSKPYTYMADFECKAGDVVLVPMRDFYSVAKVHKVVLASEYVFIPEIQYKSLIKKVL